MESRKIFFCLIVSILFSLVYLTKALAHDMWINPRAYNLDPGEAVYLTIGYGHHYLIPGGEFMPKKYLDKIYLINPEGKRLKIKSLNGIEYKSDLISKEGTYIIVAVRKGGFFTKTTEGYKRCSKKGLSNVISCKYSIKSAKAIINIGNPKGNIFLKPAGFKLEIIPLINPANLKEGDHLPIKVLFEGKPLPKEYVFATYSGFSSEKNVFAYVTKTNKDGIAKIKIIKSGIWLIIVKHNVPYPNPDECDTISCSTALTFEIK